MSRVEITHLGVDLVVEFDYSPEEPAQHYGDAPYPGCPEELEICAVFVKGVDIYPLLDDKVVDEIWQKVMDSRGGDSLDDAIEAAGGSPWI